MNHKTRVADNASVQERLGQAIDGIAPVVLRHADHAVGRRSRLPDQVTRSYGQAHRLLNHGMPMVLKRLYAQRVMIARGRCNIDSRHAQCGQFIEITNYLRPPSLNALALDRPGTRRCP